MKIIVFLFTSLVLGLANSFAQEEKSEIDFIAEASIDKKEKKKSDYQLKLEEKEAKKAVKALKKQNKLERSILKLESAQRTDGIKLKKLNERHANTKSDLKDVKREKLELKIAKLEMRMAKDKARLRKLRKKVL